MHSTKDSAPTGQVQCGIPSTDIGMANNIAFRAHGWKEEEGSNSNRDNSCINFRLSAWSQRHHARMNNALGRLFLVLVCIFNIMTVVGVAAMKSNDRKRATRMLQSPIIISGGEVTRHRFRMHATTYSGSKSGKGDKSSSSKSGKSVMLVYQPIYMTPPTVHYQATEAETPTAAPKEATDLPTYRPSSVSSTMNETLTPTAEFTTAKRQNLQMSLFGISDTELDSNQQQYFERQTGRYMEEFYNIADGGNGLLDAIKNEFSDVMVTVTIHDQEYKYTDQLRDGNRAHTFNESQIGNKGNRYLQTSTQVSEPCEGSNPLILSFSVYISYRLNGMYPIESEGVINFPFSSVSYRQNYIDDYLKNLGAAVRSEETDEASYIEKDEQVSAVFMDVYCTSRIDTAIENSELPAFAPTTDFPTLSPTFDETSAPYIIVSNAPSLKITLPPLPTFDSAETSVPTTSTQGVASTGSPTYVPTTSTSSAAPTKNGATSAVPTTQSSSRLTTAPPTSLTPSLTQSFTLSREPSPSTFTAGTVAPTSNATPQITSVIPTVAFEDNVGPADLTSVVEDSLGLTLSPRPSNLEVENTFVPTIYTLLNEVPTPSRSNPPTLQTSNIPTFASSSKQNGFEAAVSDVSSPSSSSGATPDQFQFSVTTPTPTVIDMFGNLRAADSAATERICSDTIRFVPVDRRDEFEVAFMYSVEYNSADIHDYVDDLENLILDFAAKYVLQCEGENEDTVESRNLEAKNVYEGVIGIRYPEFGQITSISYCDTFTSLQANGCAILISKLIVTSVGVPYVEVHHDILLFLEDIFKDRVVKVMPELLATFYLGPDPDAFGLPKVLISEPNSAKICTSTTTLVTIVICCSLMLSMKGFR